MVRIRVRCLVCVCGVPLNYHFVYTRLTQTTTRTQLFVVNGDVQRMEKVATPPSQAMIYSQSQLIHANINHLYTTCLPCVSTRSVSVCPMVRSVKVHLYTNPIPSTERVAIFTHRNVTLIRFHRLFIAGRNREQYCHQIHRLGLWTRDIRSVAAELGIRSRSFLL